MAELICECCGCRKFDETTEQVVCKRCGFQYSLAEARKIRSSEGQKPLSDRETMLAALETAMEQNNIKEMEQLASKLQAAYPKDNEVLAEAARAKERAASLNCRQNIGEITAHLERNQFRFTNSLVSEIPHWDRYITLSEQYSVSQKTMERFEEALRALYRNLCQYAVVAKIDKDKVPFPNHPILQLMQMRLMLYDAKMKENNAEAILKNKRDILSYARHERRSVGVSRFFYGLGMWVCLLLTLTCVAGGFIAVRDHVPGLLIILIPSFLIIGGVTLKFFFDLRDLRPRKALREAVEKAKQEISTEERAYKENRDSIQELTRRITAMEKELNL